MTTILGYKGFNNKLQCTSGSETFQYEVGKTYEETTAIPCKCGFHFCKNPFEVLNIYGICGSRFAVVEAGADTAIDHEGKTVTKKITIKAELSFVAFIKECVAYILHMRDSKNNDVLNVGSSGYFAKIGSSGDYAKINSSGYFAQIGSIGDCAKIGSSGDYAKINSSGYFAQIGSIGDCAQIGSSGNYAQIGSTGCGAKIGSSGNYAQIECSGNDSVVAAKGCWIVLAEYDSDGRPVTVKSVKIDGRKMKADTYYTLKRGKFVQIGA